MCRLLPCIPIFKGFFLLKVQKESVYVIMLKIPLVLVKICFGGKKEYKRIVSQVAPKPTAVLVCNNEDDWSFCFDWDSLHARLNSYYEVWSYMKKNYKKIKVYRKSVLKDPTVKRCLLILDLNSFRL